MENKQESLNVNQNTNDNNTYNYSTGPMTVPIIVNIIVLGVLSGLIIYYFITKHYFFFPFSFLLIYFLILNICEGILKVDLQFDFNNKIFICKNYYYLFFCNKTYQYNIDEIESFRIEYCLTTCRRRRERRYNLELYLILKNGQNVKLVFKRDHMVIVHEMRDFLNKFYTIILFDKDDANTQIIEKNNNNNNNNNQINQNYNNEFEMNSTSINTN